MCQCVLKFFFCVSQEHNPSHSVRWSFFMSVWPYCTHFTLAEREIQRHWCSVSNLKGDTVFLFLRFLQCVLSALICEKPWKLKRRKHCSCKCHQSLLKFCDCVTSHHVTMSNMCIIYGYIHRRNDANSKLKLWQSHPKMHWAVLAQGCVSWPLRGYWVFRRGS